MQALLFQIDYPEVAEGIVPRHRFMSSFEQKIQPPDKRWQYLLFAAEPYETIAFKIPSREIDKSDDKFWTLWNRETKQVSGILNNKINWEWGRRFGYSQCWCMITSFKLHSFSQAVSNYHELGNYEE